MLNVCVASGDCAAPAAVSTEAGCFEDIALSRSHAVDPFDLEEFEDQALAEGKSATDLEKQASADERQAASIEAALRAAEEQCAAMIDPASGLVPCYRESGKAASVVTFIRLGFKLAALKSAVRRLRNRALRLRRVADRMMNAQPKCILEAA